MTNGEEKGVVYWAPLFHFYQPPTQFYHILKKVCEESYRPLLQLFRQYPYVKATININAVLTEMLWEHGFSDIIVGLQELAARGQIEFTGSAKYHPILPLLPKELVERQIRRNHLTNRYFFKEAYAPRGFFPPELAYSRDLVEPVVSSRHQWVLVSGVACPRPWPLDVIYEVSHDEEPLAVFFRDDIISNKISFHNIDAPGFLIQLRQLQGNRPQIYVITAMDAETFGHHIQHWERLFLAEVYEALEPEKTAYRSLKGRRAVAEVHRTLFDVYGEKGEGGVKTATISELLDLFPRAGRVEPRASSWSTSLEDIKASNPYPLWKGKGNVIHKWQWEHVHINLELVKRASEVADNEVSRRHALIARDLLDRSLHSCQFWWATPPWRWDINMVFRGLLQQKEVLLNAYKAVAASGATEEVKRECYYKIVAARDLANRITDQLYVS